MFLGEYQYLIDEKGRLAIPPKFRKAFGDGMVATRGFDACIIAYPLPEWSMMAEKRAKLPITRSSVRIGNRYTFANAFSLTLDRQGRVLIPPALREHGRLKNEVVVMGLHTYIEIWAKELWDEEKALMAERGWQIGESIDLPE